MHLVVCYDVVKDRRRARLADRLERWIRRVQKSVFEGKIAAKDLERLRKAARTEIDPETDGVRIYRLCARCIEAVEVIGAGPAVVEGPEDVIL